MSWSFAFIGPLLLLFPGFCGLAGFLSGARDDTLSPYPDKKLQSASVVLIILAAALIAHGVVLGLLVIQEYLCAVPGAQCIALSFNPDPYRAVLSGDAEFAKQSWPIFVAVSGLLALGLAASAIGRMIGSSRLTQDFFQPDGVVWLRTIAEDARADGQVVLARVISSTGGNGRYLGYEGMVVHISPGDCDRIETVVLSAVDRFVVSFNENGVERRGPYEARQDSIQLTRGEFTHIGFNVFPLPEDWVEANRARFALKTWQRADLHTYERWRLYLFGIRPSRPRQASGTA
ncbi:MAG: hypothetical protein AAF127_16605 [Pseudomonadota bacterium]